MKLLTGQDLLTMLIKGLDLSNIWVGDPTNVRDKVVTKYFVMCPAKELPLVRALDPNIIIIDISK